MDHSIFKVYPAMAGDRTPLLPKSDRQGTMCVLLCSSAEGRWDVGLLLLWALVLIAGTQMSVQAFTFSVSRSSKVELMDQIPNLEVLVWEELSHYFQKHLHLPTMLTFPPTVEGFRLHLSSSPTACYLLVSVCCLFRKSHHNVCAVRPHNPPCVPLNSHIL